jgi:hypothetical protein
MTKKGQLADGALSKRWPEARVHQLDEAVPCQRSPVQLQPMEPQLGVVEEVECGVSHALVIWGSLHTEVSLTAIQPWQQVPFAVKFGELELVSCRKEVTARVVVVVKTTTTVRVGTAARVLSLVLETRESDVERGLLLSLVTHNLSRATSAWGTDYMVRMISSIA